MSALHGIIRRNIRVRKKFVIKLAWVFFAFFVIWGIYDQVGKRLLRPIARAQLKQLAGTGVAIDSVDFKGGVVVMKGLRISDSRQPFGQADILNANKVDIHFSFISMLRFQPLIKRITVKQPLINAMFDTESGHWNLGLLNIKRGSKAAILPDVEIIDGIVNISTVSGPVFKSVTTCGIGGTLLGVKSRVDTYNYYLRVDKRFGFEGSVLRGFWKKGKQGRFTMTGDVWMSKSPVFENAWDMRQIDLEMEYDETDLLIKHFKWSMAAGTKVLLSGSLNDYKDKPNYSLKLELDDVLISPDRRDDALVYSEPIVSILDEGLKKFLDRYRPRGTGDMQMELSGTFGQADKATAKGVINCKDISVRDRKFPYLIEHITGTVDIDNKKVVLNDLKAKHNKVDLALNGFTDIVDGEPVYDVQVTSDNMLMDRDLYKALTTPQKKLWFIFAPSGIAKVDQKLVKRPGAKPETSLKVELVDIESIYQHFPYPLKNLTGTVLFRQGKLELKDIRSHYDDKTITLNGNVTDAESERPQFNIMISARNIPIDDALKQSLPASQREFYDYFELDAMTDVDIKVFPNQVGRRLVEYIAYIKIMGTSLVYEKFPLHLTDLYVDAVLTPDMIKLKEVKGKSGKDGTFNMDGVAWPVNDYFPQVGYCFNVEAENLELNSDLLKAVPKEVSEFILPLGPRGNINVSAVINSEARDPDCGDYRIEIECIENSFNLDRLPSPIDNVTGDIIVTADTIELKGLTATGLSDEALETTITKIALDGLANYQMGRGITSGYADFVADDLRVKDKKIDTLYGRLFYDPNSMTVTGTDISGTAYDGKIIGDVHLKMPGDEDIEYILQFFINDMDVKELLTSPQQPESNIQGDMKGAISLSGTLGDVASNTGRLTMAVSDMKLARRSLLGKIVTALQLNDPADFMFSDLTVEAYMRRKTIVFENVYMSGKGIVLQGRGSYDLGSGIVDLNFNASGRKVTSTPSMLESLAKGLGPAMTKVRVYGPLDTADISAEIPVIKSPFDFLGEKK